AREDAAADEAKGRGRATDPVSAIFGKLPFAGAAAERVTGSLEDVARETVKPLQDAGQEFLGRFDQEKISTRVESLLHQAADVTAVVDAEPDVVDGEVVDLDGSENVAGAAADVPTADAAADAEEAVTEGDEAVAEAGQRSADASDDESEGNAN